MIDKDIEETVKQMSSHLEKFKEMSHRAKLRIERLAELSLEIEGELKQMEFAERVTDLFGIANEFEEKIELLIRDYEMERNRMENENK